MKKYIIQISFLFFFSESSMAVTRYWVAAVGGNYSVATNWNTASNGTGSSGAPVNTDDIVIDRNAAITIDGTYSPSSLSIKNNAVVVFTTTAARTYVIGGGSVSPAFKIEVGSTLNVLGTASITINMAFGSIAHIFGTLDFSGTSSKMDYATGALSATTIVKTGGKIRYGGTSSNGTGSVTSFFMESGSIYEVYKNGGSFPTGTYDPNSLILNTGAVANPAGLLMSSATGSYGNYEFNSPGCTNTTIGFNNNLTLNNFTLTSTGSGKWVFSTSPSNSYTLTINGNLNVAAANTFDINRAATGTQPTTVLVKGNVTIDGIVTESGGNSGSIIEFGGSASSTFSAAASAFINDVSIKLNKSLASVVALSDINLPNSANALLVFTNGNLDAKTNNKTIFAQNPAATAITGGSLASHIIGKLKRTSNLAVEYSFPVSNNDAQWAKASVTPTSNLSTNWTVEFLTPNPNSQIGLTPGIIDAVTDFYWNIGATASGAPAASSLKFYYDGLIIPTVISPSQVKVVRWTGSLWTSMGGVDGGGNVANTLGTTGGTSPANPVTAFGPFALGGISGIVPVKIESFSGAALRNTNKLAWKINCTAASFVHISLERSSDARTFNPVYGLDANADQCAATFEYIDAEPLTGNNFYRIKLTDQDGSIAYSHILTLRNTKASFSAIVYPNPVINATSLRIFSEATVVVNIVITDAKGGVVSSFSQSLVKGNNNKQIDLSLFPAGLYNVRVIRSAGDMQDIQLMKQ